MTSPPKDPTTPAASDAQKDDVLGNSTPEATPPKKKIDPWHFGAHTVPPQLRAELSAMTLPDSPEERRYRRPNAETASDSPAPPVDTSRAEPTVMIPRVALRKDKRVVVASVLGVALLLLVAAALSRGTRSSANPATQSPDGQPSPAENVAPPTSTDASADPNPAATSTAITHPATAPSVTAPVTPPDAGDRDNGNQSSHKTRNSTPPTTPTQAKPTTAAPTSSAAPRPSSGRLIPADD